MDGRGPPIPADTRCTLATGIELPIIGKAQLIKNNRAVGRLQDLADVEELEKLDGGA